ncbi:SUMF1/EgtB/PvdO family nonheme iron enzyme [Marinomonas spartinae]|uniref:SUMF1/EgtB/PvdO family nonheme iron enzyme n=1 Tax=Marinomonas spartinae TaxID=1792290 RepID=UPI0018F267FB|nr:SUMF1/EgtB/PvdO family nonheme iron enzyme [Marinomonas spartinae]MBJ7555378.1 SUMF1/EgtB/PvdO family nonheme iron enzyme [Marinomonas spartinae]
MATVTNQPAAVQPTGAPFLEGIAALRETNEFAAKTHQVLEEMVTQDKDVSITDASGTMHTFASLVKLDREIAAQRSSLANDYADKTASLTISATMGYRNAVEKASGGRNTLITDAQGNDNIMVVIPRFNYEDLELPELNLGTGTMTAFLTNGAPRSEVMISKYINSTLSTGGFASIGGAIPRNYINFDTAKSLCTNKGSGWHMMSQHEWEALRLISLKFNAEMRGNTYWGRTHDSRFENATRTDARAAGDTTGDGRTKTGQGPLSWTHDGSPYGVCDLVGNVWEWVDQLKIVDGQIICTLDNNPSAAEADWIAQAAFYDNATGTPKLNSQVVSQSDGSQYSYSALNSNVTKDASYVLNELMRRLGVEHAAPSSKGAIYARNAGERLPLRGGHWYNTSDAGPAALALNNARSYSSNFLGSRSAFFA